jgi:hypothetical protein
MWRRLGWPFFVLLPAVSTWLVWLYLNDAWTPLLSYMSLALGTVTAFLILVYFARLRAAEGFFEKTNAPRVNLIFSEDGVRTESELGSTDLKWSVFEELLKFNDVWLLVYARSGYMTLPVCQLTVECKQFIELHVQPVQRK